MLPCCAPPALACCTSHLCISTALHLPSLLAPAPAVSRLFFVLRDEIRVVRETLALVRGVIDLVLFFRTTNFNTGGAGRRLLADGTEAPTISDEQAVAMLKAQT